MWKFSSYPTGRKLPTPPELLFPMSPATIQTHTVHKFLLLLLKVADFRIWHTALLSYDSDYPLILVANSDSYKTLIPKRRNDVSNLPVAIIKKLGQIAVRRKTASLVVEAVNFYEEDFLHKRQFIGKPYLSRNPDPLKIPFEFVHCLYSTLYSSFS
jgi:hypothetical protein